MASLHVRQKLAQPFLDTTTCPHCYRMMIPVGGFDRRRDRLSNASGNENDGPDLFTHSILDLVRWAIWCVRFVLTLLFGWIGPNLLNRRHRRVEKQFPRSLYCSGSGHIAKTRLIATIDSGAFGVT